MTSFTLTDLWRLVICILICQLAGVIGSIPNMEAIPGWYASLNKPSFNPPNWIFAPVWITLYVLMGIAAFLVWRRGLANPAIKTALILFVIQLILNALWTWIFFGWKLTLIAFFEIIVLWILILITMFRFFALSATAGLLMIPYLIWVSFASILNFAIWKLN